MEDQLEERRKKVEAQFEDIKNQKIQKESEVNELDVEMARLQGEWRLLNDLKSSQVENVSKKADTIDIKEKK